MNVLQKRAWSELAFMLVCTAITAVALAFMVHMNSKGLSYVIICVAVGTPTGLVACLHNIKTVRQYDERERAILHRATMLGGFVLALVMGCASFVAFFVVGGAGTVPVYVLPAMFLGGLGAAQCTQSAVILIQFAREQVDE